MHVADLLLERVGVLAAKADIAPEAPGLHFVAAVLQEELQRDHRHLVGHEPRQEQHRMAIAARHPHEQGKVPGQDRQLEQRTPLEELVKQPGLADVGLSDGHRSSSVQASAVTRHAVDASLVQRRHCRMRRARATSIRAALR
jgi:hypothetical protein